MNYLIKDKLIKSSLTLQGRKKELMYYPVGAEIKG